MNDVISAISRLERLRRRLPRTEYDVYQELQAISDMVPEEFPNKASVIDLISSIESRANPDGSIDVMSDEAKKIDELRIGLEIFAKFEELRKALSKFEERISQIADVFPPKHFDFRSIVDELNENVISPTVIERLRTSIKYFDEGNFENVIEESAKASEALTEKFVEFIGDTPETNWWSTLEKLYKQLSGVSTSDLRWFIWSLLSTHHKTRVAHDTKTQKIPEWMDGYKKQMRKMPEWARISVICALQAAKEFQKLVENKEATGEQQ